MFDNLSEGFFFTGGVGYLIAVPILRMFATLFMAISTYKILKARQDNHKILWIIFICLSPILTRIAFEIYRRWPAKQNTKGMISGYTAKFSSNLFLIISIVCYVISAIILIVSIALMGVGLIKSCVDDEPLSAVYDMKGNTYSFLDYFEIPLYDREGNVYTANIHFLFTNYVDQSGNEFSSDRCYIDENGYFYYDEDDKLRPYQEYDDYYSDGKIIYYNLWKDYAYWEKDGTICANNGKISYKLFDFK